MKITRTELEEVEGAITVWTDVIPHTGFSFNLDDIQSKADLQNKVEQRLSVFQTEKEIKEARKAKYEGIKCQKQI